MATKKIVPTQYELAIREERRSPYAYAASDKYRRCCQSALIALVENFKHRLFLHQPIE